MLGGGHALENYNWRGFLYYLFSFCMPRWVVVSVNGWRLQQPAEAIGGYWTRPAVRGCLTLTGKWNI